MTLETQTTLTEESIANLQDLITINTDSVAGLLEAANEVEDPAVAKVFCETATERRNFADELKVYVEWNGEEACREKSFAAKVHQTWLSLRAKLNGGDAQVILNEAEYGEDQIKSAYEEVLKGNPGSAMSEVLHSQYAVVKKGHDRIRDLRDSYAAK